MQNIIIEGTVGRWSAWQNGQSFYNVLRGTLIIECQAGLGHTVGPNKERLQWHNMQNVVVMTQARPRASITNRN